MTDGSAQSSGRTERTQSAERTDRSHSTGQRDGSQTLDRTDRSRSTGRTDGSRSTERADKSESPDPPPLWRNTDFRRFFAGQFVTNVGDSLYSVAVVWIVFELSGSSTLAGAANAVLLLPFLLQIAAGPVVDRLPAGRLLVGTQVVQGVVVLVFPVAAATGRLTVGVVFVTLPVLALVTTLSGPLRAAVVPRIVPESQLSRGNSALSTVTLGLDMLFDAAGGVLIAAVGATALFLADAATFAVATLLFAATRIPRATPDDETSSASNRTTDDASATETTGEGAATGTGDDRTATETGEEGAATVTGDDRTVTESGDERSATETVRTALSAYLADLRAGVAVVRGSTFVELVAVSAVFNFAVGVTLATLPAYGATLGGPAVYGALLGALGVGRLVGSVSASLLDRVPYGRLRAVTAALAAGCWLGAALTPSVVATLALFGLAWVAAGLDDVLTSTINQRVFPTDLLGRVSAIKGTAATATLPLGSVIGGVVADALGAQATMAATAGGFAVVACAFTLRGSLRRLPRVAAVEPADFRLSFDAPPAGRADATDDAERS